MVKDLLDFKEQRIKALESEVKRLKIYQSQLETYIYELTDDDCPKEYKTVVKQEVFYNNV